MVICYMLQWLTCAQYWKLFVVCYICPLAWSVQFHRNYNQCDWHSSESVWPSYPSCHSTRHVQPVMVNDLICWWINVLKLRHFDNLAGYLIVEKQESWAITKMTVWCAVCMGALKIYGSPWVCPRLFFPKILMGFCFNWGYWAYKCASKIWIS